jgi:hypothetical protein
LCSFKTDAFLENASLDSGPEIFIDSSFYPLTSAGPAPTLSSTRTPAGPAPTLSFPSPRARAHCRFLHLDHAPAAGLLLSRPTFPNPTIGPHRPISLISPVHSSPSLPRGGSTSASVGSPTPLGWLSLLLPPPRRLFPSTSDQAARFGALGAASAGSVPDRNPNPRRCDPRGTHPADGLPPHSSLCADPTREVANRARWRRIGAGGGPSPRKLPSLSSWVSLLLNCDDVQPSAEQHLFLQGYCSYSSRCAHSESSLLTSFDTNF